MRTIYRPSLVSAQVHAYPSIRSSLRTYFGALAETRYHWLMPIAPRRGPLSLHQQASPAAIIILKIIPEKWSRHWIIQPSSLVGTLCDLWHHCSWLHFSRCVRQKILKQELNSQNTQVRLNAAFFLKPCANTRKRLHRLKSAVWSGFATKAQSGLICTAM